MLMNDRVRQLSEKERETLRLLLRGYDAKTSARRLGLSVHTVNERLRDARRKLSVSSSREAARILHEAEGDPPDSLGDKDLGDALVAGHRSSPAPSDQGKAARRRTLWIITGGAIMSLVLALYALSSFGGLSSGGAASAASEAAATVEAEQSARTWLALVDGEDWNGAYVQAGQSFRQNNTVEGWTAAATGVRAKYGTTSGRALINSEWVPAPPNGYRIVKFRTKTSKEGLITETLSLAEEGGVWRVVGIVID